MIIKFQIKTFFTFCLFTLLLFTCFFDKKNSLSRILNEYKKRNRRNQKPCSIALSTLSPNFLPILNDALKFKLVASGRIKFNDSSLTYQKSPPKKF